MKLNYVFYRLFMYFAQGYNYLSFPLSIASTLTVLYYLLVDHVAFLGSFFSSFGLFAVIAVAIFIPFSVGIGWISMKRSLFYGEQNVVAIEANPLSVHGSRVQYEMTLMMLEKLGITPSQEYLNLLEYWRSLDKKQNWRPDSGSKSI